MILFAVDQAMEAPRKLVGRVPGDTQDPARWRISTTKYLQRWVIDTQPVPRLLFLKFLNKASGQQTVS